MTTIVDASVALKWFFVEDGSDRAAGLLDGRPLAAPAMWLAEAANAIWRRRTLGEIAKKDALGILADLSEADVENIDIASLIGPAYRIAEDLSHPIYDCLYLAAAIERDTFVVTADRRFIRVASVNARLKSRVRPL